MNSNSPLVTVVIPVFNVQQYLDRCMESVLKQTYENLEIIIVDDGSTDSSGEICDEYKKRDDRVKVIHQENKGLSAARNAAIDVMQGDYVIFIDSDDCVTNSIIEELQKSITEYDCDIAESNFKDVYDTFERTRWHHHGKIVCNTEKALEYDISGVGGVVSACGKLYKKDIFKDVRFPLGKLGEDGYSIVDIVSKANRIVIDERPMYFYYHRSNSITTQTFDEKFFDNVTAYKRNYEMVKNDYPRAADAVLYRLDWSYIDIVDRILISENWENNKHLNKCINHIKENFSRILSSKYMRKNRKIGVCLMLLNKKLYRKLLLIDAKRKKRVCF